MEFLQGHVQHFSLVVGRLSPLFLAINLSPFSRFPGTVRLVMLLVVSITFYLLVDQPITYADKLYWGINLLHEIVLGLLMLVGLQLTYAAIMVVGRVLDMQIGFAAAGIVDPLSNNNDPLLGYVFTLFISLAVFLTGTHHQILQALKVSFELIPAGSWHGQVNIANLAGFFTSQSILALLVLSPVLLGLWLIDLFNGLISKSMPQMNVYFVMLPLKILAGMAIFAASVPHVKPHVKEMFAQVVNWYSGGFAL